MTGSNRVGARAAGGAAVLTAGTIIYDAISAAGSVVIARLLGPADYGVLGIALIYPMMLSGLADLGLSTAIMRYASLGDTRRALTALWLRVIAGALLAAAAALLAPLMAASLQRPHLAPVICVLSAYVLANVAATSVTAFLAGVNRFWDVVSVDVVRSAVRVASSALLIMLGYGVYGAALGFSAGYSAAAAYAFVKLARLTRVAPDLARKPVADVLGYSLPLYVPALLGIPAGQLYNMLLAVYVTDAEMGNYRVASNLLAPLGIITGALSTSLFTTLPRLAAERYKLVEALDRAARYIALLVSPVSIALALFSRQAVYAIYGAQYDAAPAYLAIMALSGLLAPFGMLGMYLNIIGATRTTMLLNVAGMAIGLPLTWALLVCCGMLGAVSAFLMGSALNAAVSLAVVKWKYGVSLRVPRVARYWLPSLTAGAPAYMAMRAIGDVWLAAGVGLATYLVMLVVLTAAVTSSEDLANLASISGGIKYAGPLISRALNIAARLKAVM
jgi:PST family polysaccharide transporter